MRGSVSRGMLAGLLLVGLVVGTLEAQRQRASPREKVSRVIHGAAITIDYSRPFMKGRRIFAADGLVPFGKVWRTGADEATTLVTDRPLKLDGLEVPAGSYTLYTIPAQETWTLIVNKQTGQWGTVYQEAMDLGRVTMRVARVDPAVEQFEIDVVETASGGELRFTWEHSRAVVAFTIGP